MKMTRMIALSIPIAFMLLDFAMPVSAMKPEVTEWTGHIEGPILDCGAFTIYGNWDGRQRLITHFDNNGEPDWMDLSSHFYGTVRNSVSGLTVKDDEVWHEYYNYATNTWVVDGHLAHLTIPGKGLVLIESGHSVYHWSEEQNLWLPHEHGRPHDLTSVYWLDLTPYCDALA